MAKVRQAARASARSTHGSVQPGNPVRAGFSRVLVPPHGPEASA
jgi:hypothetical protein